MSAAAATVVSDDMADVERSLARGQALVPDHLWDGLRGYILFGLENGTFLSAVFANDLLSAATGADEVSLGRLPDLMRFMHNYAPELCWGSKAVRNSWRRLGGVEGGACRDAAHEALFERSKA